MRARLCVLAGGSAHFNAGETSESHANFLGMALPLANEGLCIENGILEPPEASDVVCCAVLAWPPDWQPASTRTKIRIRAECAGCREGVEAGCMVFASGLWYRKSRHANSVFHLRKLFYIRFMASDYEFVARAAEIA